jgi:hypothetical protein
MSCDSECSICERLQDLAVALVADGGAEALSFEVLSERASRPTRRWRQWRLIGSASRGAARP